MQTQSNHPSQNEGILFYLLLLTGFFILLEISYFIQCNKAYLSDFTFVSSQMRLPVRILPDIFFFLLAQFLVHLAFVLVVWFVAYFSAVCLRLSSKRRVQAAILSWIMGMLWVLAANQSWFPNSKLVELTSMALVNHTVTAWVFSLSGGIFLLLTLLAMLGFIRWIRLTRRRLIVLLTISIAAVLAYYYPFFPAPFAAADGASVERPNIIIVGVDSLRPDFLGYFGGGSPTPFFDTFLNQATVFDDAVTPLARTFPSWTGILTGQYPAQVNVRTNLANPAQVQLAEALPALLQEQGYETVFATDETRFSNVDRYFGFSQIISPPVGLNDFLLGTFNDFPLSNLMINSFLGQWLFPYSYANRPVYATYEPDSFLRLIRPTLNQPHPQPLFLAIHFCLPHYPYLWAGLPGNDYTVLERYQASIHRVDQQLAGFFSMLNKAKLLNHAIVILLSDHGEALELSGDRVTENERFVSTGPHQKPVPVFYPPSLDQELINQSAGHGTDVLGLPQYHCLLAFRLYGTGKQRTGEVPGMVSLLDIKPTLLDLLRHRPSVASGVSLARVLRGQAKSVPLSTLFLESDYSPQAIRTVYPETRDVLLEGIKLFQIDPFTTRLTVKEDMARMIIRSKQFAEIDGNWMLALYPQDQHKRMPILVNLADGRWTNDLDSHFAHQSPAARMMKQLTHFYPELRG